MKLIARGIELDSLLRIVATVALWALCSAGTCHVHATSGNCHHHTTDPNHHCGHTHISAQTSGHELNAYRARPVSSEGGVSIVRFRNLDEMVAQHGNLVPFAFKVLEANRDVLDLAPSSYEFEGLAKRSQGLDVQFVARRSTRTATDRVVFSFDAQSRLQQIDVHTSRVRPHL